MDWGLIGVAGVLTIFFSYYIFRLIIPLEQVVTLNDVWKQSSGKYLIGLYLLFFIGIISSLKVLVFMILLFSGLVLAGVFKYKNTKSQLDSYRPILKQKEIFFWIQSGFSLVFLIFTLFTLNS